MRKTILGLIVLIATTLCWAALADEANFVLNGQQKIEDLGTTTITFDLAGPNSITEITLDAVITHRHVGDLKVTLIAPTGTRAVLHNRQLGPQRYLKIHKTSDNLKMFLGEDPNGTWKLEIRDEEYKDDGEIKSLFIHVTSDEVIHEEEQQEILPEVNEEEVEDEVDPEAVVRPTTQPSGTCSERWEQIVSNHPVLPEYAGLINICGDEFKYQLRQLINDNVDLGYRGARQQMFTSIDNFDGIVRSVYSEDQIETHSIPNSSVFNCEHTWPQSMGATGIAKSDLHHLYPVESRINSKRGNHPFCEVDAAERTSTTGVLGQSRISGRKCFEPPMNHKGNVARSMFYFSVRYGKNIDPEQAKFLEAWNLQDPVDQAEMIRMEKIEAVQGNRNPFVEYPEFAYLLNE